MEHFFRDLPELASHKILQCVAKQADKDPTGLLALAQVDRWCRDWVASDSSAMEMALQRNEKVQDRCEGAPANVSTRDQLRLGATIGCMTCGAARIRKITWPFLTRSCKACIHKNTLSHYRIETDLGLSPSLWQHLPHTTAELWSRYHGTYQLRFYWKKHIDPILHQTRGFATVDAYQGHKAEQERIRREEETKKLKARESLLLKWCLEKDASLTQPWLVQHSINFKINSLKKTTLRPSYFEKLWPMIHREIEHARDELRRKQIALELEERTRQQFSHSEAIGAAILEKHPPLHGPFTWEQAIAVGRAQQRTKVLPGEMRGITRRMYCPFCPKINTNTYLCHELVPHCIRKHSAALSGT